MMNSNTTLAIIAIVAALGLLTTLMVVEPSIPQAIAQGQSFNKFRACGTPGESHVPHCIP